jgi:hypothetical protein
MSWSKHHAAEVENAAIAIAVQAKVLAPCQVCSELVTVGNEEDDWHTYTSAYRLGNSLISRDDSPTRCFNGNRQEMTDAVQSLCRDRELENGLSNNTASDYSG